MADTPNAGVELSSLVVFQMINHSRDSWPELAVGSLLGMERDDGILEITGSFPTLTSADLEPNEDLEQVSQQYQKGMMHCLREVNVDHMSLGWYTSSLMGSYLNDVTIETQYQYQSTLKNGTVLLIYDPVKTSQQGVLSIRALRLTAAFMELYKTQGFTKEGMSKSGLAYNGIYEEVPVVIHNLQLITAYLADLDDTANDASFDRLDLSTNGYLEKNLEYVTDCLDDLAGEQGKLQYFQRNLQRQMAQQSAWVQKRKAENLSRKANGEEPLPETDPNNPIFKPLPEPPRLESLLIENHVELFCNQLNRFAAQSLAKIHLAETLL